MSKRILLIDHHDNLRDDRATVFLKQMGFEIDLCMPVNGDSLPEIDENMAGVVIYGGEHNVTELDKFPFLLDEIQWITNAIELNLPILGICLGAQLIAYSLGAKVDYHDKGLCEFGYYKITPTDAAGDWINQDMYVTQAHYQQLWLPDGAVLLATGTEFPNQAFQFNNNVFGLQFHPEVSATIFRRWQDSDWAFFDRDGSQTREQQNQLIDDADKIQGQWFYHFLEKVFGHPASLQAN